MSRNNSNLTQARLRELLRYDPATGHFSWVTKGSGRWKDIAGCTNRLGYRVIRIDGQMYYAHRLAWLYVRGTWPDGEIDHKDGDRSNNSLINLRSVTHAENMQNAKCGVRTATDEKLPGAYREKSSGRWRSAISIQGKYKHLGTFATPEEAGAAYMDARRKLHPGQLIDWPQQAPA